MKRWGGQGVEGFSEELPALLVVLVAISLFVASAAQAYATYGSRQAALRERERVESFATMICADEELAWSGRLGMFHIASLSDSNASASFESRYNSTIIGFSYIVTISDQYSTDSWAFASGPGYASGEKVRIARACNLFEPGGFVRPAILEVEAWGMYR